MTTPINDIATRFLAEKHCTRQELSELKRWLADPASQPEIDSWLAELWVTAPEIDSTTLIETIFKQIPDQRNIHHKKSGFSLARIINVYQKIAAFLLIPLIGAGILYFVSQYHQSEDQFSETFAPRGQKSQIVLADGTKVWLNSDTKIKYPTNFNRNQRDVYLSGEAFFEVTKNAHLPFVVHATGLSVKVLGTKFNVKAYADEDMIETSLFEGQISLLMSNPWSRETAEKEVKPGQSFLYSKTNRELAYNRFPEEEICGWKKNQLIFKDDAFSNLVKKVERWYDVQIIYDEKQFDDRRLTVELYEGEQLDRLMNIISLALSVNYQYLKGKIILTPKS